MGQNTPAIRCLAQSRGTYSSREPAVPLIRVGEWREPRPPAGPAGNVEEQPVPRILIDAEQCKGCGLCVEACPQQVIAVGKRINARGQLYATPAVPAHCIGCRCCAIACPEAAVEVRVWGMSYECLAY